MQLVALAVGCASDSAGWIYPTCVVLEDAHSWSISAAPWFLDSQDGTAIAGECAFHGPGVVVGSTEVLAGTLAGSQCTGVRFWPTNPFPVSGRYELECSGGQDFDWSIEVTNTPSPDVGFLESVDLLDSSESSTVVVRLNGLSETATEQGALLRVSTREGTGFAPAPLFVVGESDPCVADEMLTVFAEDSDGIAIGSAAVPIPCE
jgi:hypothetical protein